MEIKTKYNFIRLGVYHKSPVMRAMSGLKRVGIMPGQKFLDLGSGEGTIDFLVASLFKARCTGIEGDDYRFSKSQKGSRALERAGMILPEQVKFINGNFIKFSWKSFDFIYYEALGTWKENFEPLVEKVILELKPKAKFLVLGCSRLYKPDYVYSFEGDLGRLMDSPEFLFESVPECGLWIFTRSASSPSSSSSPVKEISTDTSPRSVQSWMQNEIRLLEQDVERWLKDKNISLSFIEQSLLGRFKKLMRKDPVTLNEILNKPPGLHIYNFFRTRSVGETFTRQLARKIAQVRARQAEQRRTVKRRG